MPTRPVIRKDVTRPNPQTKATTTARPQPPPAAPSSEPVVDGKATPFTEHLVALRKQIPEMLLSYEPAPISAYCNNPVLNERSAAALLGVSQDLMNKWRQRNWGPDYIQYGKAGPVRYELNELVKFRDRHKVQAWSTW